MNIKRLFFLCICTCVASHVHADTQDVTFSIHSFTRIYDETDDTEVSFVNAFSDFSYIQFDKNEATPSENQFLAFHYLDYNEIEIEEDSDRENGLYYILYYVSKDGDGEVSEEGLLNVSFENSTEEMNETVVGFIRRDRVGWDAYASDEKKGFFDGATGTIVSDDEISPKSGEISLNLQDVNTGEMLEFVDPVEISDTLKNDEYIVYETDAYGDYVYDDYGDREIEATYEYLKFDTPYYSHDVFIKFFEPSRISIGESSYYSLLHLDVSFSGMGIFERNVFGDVSDTDPLDGTQILIYEHNEDLNGDGIVEVQSDKDGDGIFDLFDTVQASTAPEEVYKPAHASYIVPGRVNQYWLNALWDWAYTTEVIEPWYYSWKMGWLYAAETTSTDDFWGWISFLQTWSYLSYKESEWVYSTQLGWIYIYGLSDDGTELFFAIYTLEGPRNFAITEGEFPVMTDQLSDEVWTFVERNGQKLIFLDAENNQFEIEIN